VPADLRKPHAKNSVGAVVEKIKVGSSHHPDNGIFPGIRSLFGTDDFWSGSMGPGWRLFMAAGSLVLTAGWPSIP